MAVPFKRLIRLAFIIKSSDSKRFFRNWKRNMLLMRRMVGKRRMYKMSMSSFQPALTHYRIVLIKLSKVKMI